MKVKCWVIAEPASDRPSLFEPLFANVAPKVRGGDDLHNVNGGSGTLLAIDFESLRALSPSALGALREQIKSGATCYVWGSLQADTQHSLEPLAPVSVRAQLEPQTASYLVVAKPPMPAVLQGETVIARSSVPVARGLSAIAQPLVLLRESDGSKASPLFEIEQGKGVIICDLAGSNGNFPRRTALSALGLLENPDTRLSTLGRLVAFARAAGQDTQRPVGCNIVIDDRPVSLDYLNVTALGAFLEHLRSRCPDVHIDFGWTPDQTRPSHRYIKTLKRFKAGFVWHGLLHHIDHRTLTNPEQDFAQGQRLVKAISDRYQVRFQPVMVFPYEKDTNDCIEVLKREGFIAKAQLGDEATNAPAPPATRPVREVTKTTDQNSDGFVVLARDSIENVTRDRMLARAALGMPVIVAAHPRDAGLRRFARIRAHGIDPAFDQVLAFMAEKKLRHQSLEELAVAARVPE